jgi:hypothetical protein
MIEDLSSFEIKAQKMFTFLWSREKLHPSFFPKGPSQVDLVRGYWFPPGCSSWLNFNGAFDFNFTQKLEPQGGFQIAEVSPQGRSYHTKGTLCLSSVIT